MSDSGRLTVLGCSLPMIVIMYILNYLDRNNIAAAKLAGLIEDLHLTGDQFNTSVSILFVGYLLMQGMKSEGNQDIRRYALWARLTLDQSPPT